MICQRWHVLPSAVLSEPADLVLGTLAAAAPNDLPQMSKDDEMALRIMDMAEVDG